VLDVFHPYNEHISEHRLTLWIQKQKLYIYIYIHIVAIIIGNLK